MLKIVSHFLKTKHGHCQCRNCRFVSFGCWPVTPMCPVCGRDREDREEVERNRERGRERGRLNRKKLKKQCQKSHYGCPNAWNKYWKMIAFHVERSSLNKNILPSLKHHTQNMFWQKPTKEPVKSFVVMACAPCFGQGNRVVNNLPWQFMANMMCVRSDTATHTMSSSDSSIG